MSLIVGGYFLVQGTPRQKWMSQHLLPPLLWSASTSICEIFPDSWVFPHAFPWPTNEEESYRELLRIELESFNQGQLEFDRLLEKDACGFPNVFFDPSSAQELHAKYLHRLPNIKLLSIALSPEDCETFIIRYTPAGNIGGYGVSQKLRARQTLEPEANFLGYEILGCNEAFFDSFICNSLEKEYNEKLGITFNSYGLIDSYEDALRAVDYTN